MTLAGQGDLVGQRLGRYHLDALLGAGGMAEVYRAHYFEQTSKGPRVHRVAVKVLPESLARDDGYVRRFQEEAARVRGLPNVNIVRVLDSGEERSLLYLVMPLLRESLRDRLIREGHLPTDVAVKIARQIASALSAAHVNHVIHRDVKPENILLDRNGVAFLTDFGIARQLAPRQGGTLYTLSGSGLPVGTPEYMPPEQLSGVHIDERADIYGLGAVLYEMLTGTVPFAAETPYAVAALVLAGELIPPRDHNLAISVALEQVIVKALERDPNDRFENMPLFDTALGEALKAPQRFTLSAVRNFRLTQRFAEGQGSRTGRRQPASISGAPTLPPALAGNGLASPGTGYGPVSIQTVAPGRTAVPRLPARRARGRWPWAASLLVVILAVTVCGGGTLAAANRLGLTFLPGGQADSTAPASTSLPIVVPSATAPLPTTTPVPEPTSTPHAKPTPRPTSTPIPLFTVSPLQLVKVPHSDSTCRGPQYITNNTNSAANWQWQSASPGLPSSFRWSTTSSSPNNTGWPSGTLGSGQTATLYAQIACDSQAYTVSMVDSLGRTYTFTMQSQ